VCYPNRSSVDEDRGGGGGLWKFEPNGQVGINGRHTTFPSCTVDTVFGGKKYVKDIYEAAGITDQKSVPVLIDKETKTVVNNESADILRMMGTVFTKLKRHDQGYHPIDINLYPHDKAYEIDELNDYIYVNVANGAYKAGFSSNQDVYEAAYHNFFTALDRIDGILADRKFLVGHRVTEADVRLFPPLFRLDPVYAVRFKLNHKHLAEYTNIWRWMGDMMRLPGVEELSNHEYLQHCKQGYFGRTGNGTIPVGPPGYPQCYLDAPKTHSQGTKM